MLQQLSRRLSLWFQNRISEKRRLCILWDLKGKDLVIDVGSGHNPLSRADVLSDLYVGNNAQRGSKPLKTNGKAFIISDVEHLPFKGKSFAFVNCCATIEHTRLPGLALRELTRVGKTVYITVPTLLNEILFPQSFHRCIVRKVENKLHFSSRTKIVHKIFEKIVILKLLQYLINEMTSLFTLRIVLSQEIKIGE